MLFLYYKLGSYVWGKISIFKKMTDKTFMTQLKKTQVAKNMF